MVIRVHSFPENMKLKDGWHKRVASLIFMLYLMTQIALRFSTLSDSFPWIGDYKLIESFETLVATCCIVLMILRMKAMSTLGMVSTGLFSGLLVLSAHITHDNALLMSALVLVAVSFLDLDYLFKCYYRTVGVCVAVVILLSISGVIANKDAIPNGRIVFSYGMTHPNRLGVLMVSLVMAYLYVHRSDAKRLRLYGALAVTGLFSITALSSNSALVICILLAFMLAILDLKVINRHGVIRRWLSLLFAIAVPIGCGVAMLFLTARFDGSSPLMAAIDRLIHYRARYAHGYYLSHGGFSLFGRAYGTTQTYRTGLTFQTVDCSYSYMALVYGVALLALSPCVLVRMRTILADHENSLLCFGLIAIAAVYAVMEAYPLVLASNCALLFFSRVICVHPKGELS